MVAVVLVVVFGGACGDDGGPATSFDGVESLGACDDLAGVDTEALLESGLCNEADGELLFIGTVIFDCDDGTQLIWNDYGWGYVPGELQAHEGDELVAPDADREACG